MQQSLRALLILPAFALAACATAPQMAVTNAPALTATPDATTLQQPAQTISTAAATTDASAFADPAGYALLSAKSKSEMSGAQFNALQFGRVGAPRNWYGDKGQSGNITVGPYVRVNLIDCRDFANTVTVGGQSYVKKGTACREADGSWTVSAAKAG